MFNEAEQQHVRNNTNYFGVRLALHSKYVCCSFVPGFLLNLMKGQLLQTPGRLTDVPGFYRSTLQHSRYTHRGSNISLPPPTRAPHVCVYNILIVSLYLTLRLLPYPHIAPEQIRHAYSVIS